MVADGVEVGIVATSVAPCRPRATACQRAAMARSTYCSLQALLCRRELIRRPDRPTAASAEGITAGDVVQVRGILRGEALPDASAFWAASTWSPVTGQHQHEIGLQPRIPWIFLRQRPNCSQIEQRQAVALPASMLFARQQPHIARVRRGLMARSSCARVALASTLGKLGSQQQRLIVILLGLRYSPSSRRFSSAEPIVDDPNVALTIWRGRFGSPLRTKLWLKRQCPV